MTTQTRLQAGASLRAVRHGFTLIELLVVIAIISVLSAILFPSVEKIAGDAFRKSDPYSQINKASPWR